MSYRMQRRVDDEFDRVVSRTEAALSEEGFGVLSDIDVRAAFEEKLGLEGYPRYRILGACNPALAREGLDAEPDLGALLPCNVVVREDGSGEVVVSAVDPGAMLSVVENPALDSIADDVDERFQRVLDAVAAGD
ncbi:DUF302 domain-containing protein [Halomarina pelagica]|uniref:DUF302 domain-containing protein n=1 Tax=Halomarina pelagica TaxID=2961599 RepID=UPI0020C59AA4|nr:DUF302 domain-containing protein [Halomarina sp. BND7]